MNRYILAATLSISVVVTCSSALAGYGSSGGGTKYVRVITVKSGGSSGGAVSGGSSGGVVLGGSSGGVVGGSSGGGPRSLIGAHREKRAAKALARAGYGSSGGVVSGGSSGGSTGAVRSGLLRGNGSGGGALRSHGSSGGVVRGYGSSGGGSLGSTGGSSGGSVGMFRRR